MSSRILYMTDKFRVSPGYAPAFERLVNKAGIHRGQIITSDIYNLVDKPLAKRANEVTWKFNPEQYDAIERAFAQRVRATRPAVIVVSCPAVIGVLAKGDRRLATLEKMRGGVYEYDGIPTIVTYPITAIHQRIDTRIISNDDGESDAQTPYRVKDGAQILQWDWQKVGRFFAGKQRVIPDFRYSICRTLVDCYAARDYLAECVLISPDIETGNYPPGITCAGYTGLLPNGACHSFVIPLYDEFASDGCFWSESEHAVALSVIRDINELPAIKCMQNGAYDISYFCRDRLGTKNFLLDSQLLWYSMYMELPKRLDFITSVLCDNYQYWKDDIKGDEQEKIDSGQGSMERYWRYNALDTYYTMFDTLYLVVLLMKNPAMQANYSDTLMRFYSAWKMSMRGVNIDRKRMAYHRADLVEAMDSKTAEFRYMIDDPDFNISSSPQKVSLLYDVFGLRPRNARGRYVERDGVGKGKAPSGGKIPIKLAKTEHPLFNYILNTLEAALEPRVQLSNIFGYPGEDDPHKIRGGLFMPRNRLMTSFGAAATETMRLNSKESAFWEGGNVQNIRGKYQDFIVADEDCVFLNVDFSQSDDVFISYESQDPDKIAVLESGRDVHAVNGELFFNIPYEKIVDGKEKGEDWCVHPIRGVRQNSKRSGHGGNMQMAGMTLYITMGRDAVVSCAEVLGYPDAAGWDQDRLVQLCNTLIAKYRARYKRLNPKEWYKEIADQLKTEGKIVNCFGLTRTFLSDPTEGGTQREATAYYGQSGTAGNMNRVMKEIDLGYIPPSFRDGANPDRHVKPLMMDWQSHGFAFHLQVHDNFLVQLNLRHPLWKQAAHNLLHVMDRPIIIHGRTVRVKSEAELGFRWGKEMKRWHGNVDDLDRIVSSLQR